MIDDHDLKKDIDTYFYINVVISIGSILLPFFGILSLLLHESIVKPHVKWQYEQATQELLARCTVYYWVLMIIISIASFLWAFFFTGLIFVAGIGIPLYATLLVLVWLQYVVLERDFILAVKEKLPVQSTV